MYIHTCVTVYIHTYIHIVYTYCYCYYYILLLLLLCLSSGFTLFCSMSQREHHTSSRLGTQIPDWLQQSARTFGICRVPTDTDFQREHKCTLQWSRSGFAPLLLVLVCPWRRRKYLGLASCTRLVARGYVEVGQGCGWYGGMGAF